VAEILVKIYEINLEIKHFDKIEEFFKEILNNPLVKPEQKITLSLKHV
jgi:hypothetical protein